MGDVLAVRVVSGDVHATLLRPHQVLVSAADAARLSVKAHTLWRLRAAVGKGATTHGFCCRLDVVRDRHAAQSGGLPEGVVQIHPWVLDALELLEGDPAVLQIAQGVTSAASRIGKITLAVVSRSPLRTTTSSSSFPALDATIQIESAAAAGASQLPESVRCGLVDLKLAIARQLRAMYSASGDAVAPGDLVPIQLLGETFVLRVVEVDGAYEHEDSVSLSIEVIGLTGQAPVESLAAALDGVQLADDDGDDHALQTRLWRLGYSGYTAFIQETLFHILLNFHCSDAAHGGASTSSVVQSLASRGLILHGVQGVGKSHTLRVVDNELQRRGITTWRVDAMSLLMEYEQSKAASAYEFLLAQFHQFVSGFGHRDDQVSIDTRPAGVVLVDDIYVLFQPTNGQDASETTDDEQTGLLLMPLGNAMLRFLDSMADRQSCGSQRLCIVGTSTTGVNGGGVEADGAIPTVAKRSGRFDKMVEIIVPSEAMRREILDRHLSDLPLEQLQPASTDSGHQSTASELATRLAALTGGYVAKDLVRICRCAYIHANSAKTEQDTTTFITWDHLVLAQRNIKPSQLQQLDVASPSSSSSDVSTSPFAGYEALQKQLCDFIDWKFHPTEAMKHLGIANASGLLVHGPSGCGKSLLVKAVAAKARVNFVSVKSSELLSKYFGDSEQAVRQLFARARAAAPCLLFFDEFDSIAHKRSFEGGDSGGGDGTGVYARILSTFLNEMDGVGASRNRAADILVVAATNRVDALDAALVRPGRVDKSIVLDYPEREDVQAILGYYTRKMPLADDVDLGQLAARSTGSRRFTGADIAAVCKEAAFRSLRENIEASSVHWTHFTAAWDQRTGV